MGSRLSISAGDTATNQGRGDMSQVQLTPSQERAIAQEIATGGHKKVWPIPSMHEYSRACVRIESECGLRYSLWLGKRGTWYEYATGPY